MFSVKKNAMATALLGLAMAALATPAFADYTITIPETVVLESNKSGTGTYSGKVSINANGSIEATEHLCVSAPDSFEMENIDAEKAIASIQKNTETVYDQESVAAGTTKTVYSIQADLTPGDWNGVVQFYVTLGKDYEIFLGDNSYMILGEDETRENVEYEFEDPSIATVDENGNIIPTQVGITGILKKVYADPSKTTLLYTTDYTVTVISKSMHIIDKEKIWAAFQSLTKKPSTVSFCKTSEVPANAKLIAEVEEDNETVKIGFYQSADGQTVYMAPIDDEDAVMYAPRNADWLLADKTIDGKLCAGIGQTLVTVDSKNLDFSNTISASGLLANNSTLQTIDVSGWDTSRMQDMSSMFLGCSSLTELDVGNWNLGKAKNVSSLFDGCSGLTNIDVSRWNVGNAVNLEAIFRSCTNLESVDVSNWDTSHALNLGLMFANCSKLTAIDVSKWDTHQAMSLYATFRDCIELTTVDVSNWDTGNVTSLGSTFYGCTKLETMDVSKWDTSQVTTLGTMFRDCASLKELNVSNWNTHRVANFSGTFYGCSSLTELNVNAWNTESATDLTSTFYGCSGLNELDVSNWETGKVTSLNSTFFNCKGLIKLEVETWDTSKVKRWPIHSIAVPISHLFRSLNGIPAK